MEIGESIATAAMPKLDPCWFCQEEHPADTMTNETEASPQTENNDNEDYPPENDVHNDASALGENLGDRPQWEIKRPGDDASTTIVPGAHHLIPGNASLKKAMDNGLSDFMCERGQYNLESDIGYNVNDAANGVWLPGNYQVRPGNEDYKIKWSAYPDDFKGEYAVRAMRKANAQFHDAHYDYNKNVLRTLERIKENMVLPEDGKCPICGKEYHEKTRPPFGLVSRLNFVSQQHRQILAGLNYKKSRKITMIRNGYYTSSRVYVYFGLNKP
jgi:hypothetical protein